MVAHQFHTESSRCSITWCAELMVFATSKLLNYFSKWTELRRAMACILKFKKLLLQLREQLKNTFLGPQGSSRNTNQNSRLR